MPTPTGDNPILYIEELTRLPLRRRLRPLPGTVMVYRMANGRIRVPRGGFTAGELWVLGPAFGYEVDVVRRPFTTEFTVAAAPHLTVVASGYWQAVDPARVVTHRVSDAVAVCREFVEARLRQLVAVRVDEQEAARWRSAAARLPDRCELPEGIAVTGLRVEVEPQTDGALTDGPGTQDAAEDTSREVRDADDAGSVDPPRPS